MRIEMEAVKLARLLSYRCLELRVTRCTSPEITHADTPSRQTASSTAERASGGMWACSHAFEMVGKIFWQISDFLPPTRTSAKGIWWIAEMSVMIMMLMLMMMTGL